MLAALRRRRAELDAWLTARGRAHTVSLLAWLLHEETRPRVEDHARGRCLDAGAGRSPWKPLLAGRGGSVVSVDVEDRSGQVDVVADLQQMPQVADASFDTVLCTQVLEHLPRPADALAELHRVLAPGGVLIVSVPHLSMLHEVPNDYFRFTRYGLASLLEARGFEVLEIAASGGLLALLLHPLSLALLTTLGALRPLRQPLWALNYALLVRLAAPLDRALGLRGLYPCNYVALARKPDAGERATP